MVLRFYSLKLRSRELYFIPRTLEQFINSKYLTHWIILGLFGVLLSFFSWFVSAQEIEENYIFLGNDNLPPILFVQNSKPAGLVVDLVNSLAVKSGMNIEIKLMDWTEAESIVLAGEADALLQINKNPEREKIYDFSEVLLKSNFCIFRKNERVDIQNLDTLSGYTVGVALGSYPMSLLKKYPQIKVEIITNWVEGFQLINDQKIDAIIVDKRVGEHQLSANYIQGITVVDQPVATAHSTIAVKKGNEQLLVKINQGLDKISEDGTRKKLLKKWSGEEVVYLSKKQFDYFLLSIALAFLILLLLLIILFYTRHIRKINHTLYLSNRELGQKSQELEITKSELEKQNAYLEIVSFTDRLTGICNRRYFDTTVIKEYCRCLRNSNPISILLIDIDNFKNYNDSFGHQQGDECLKKVAETINSTINRPGDFVARYGGEEFIVSLSNTSNSGALTVAERIRNSILQLKLPASPSAKHPFVSISIGVATQTPDENMQRKTELFSNAIENLIKEADETLYLAKKTGRNKVCFKK